MGNRFSRPAPEPVRESAPDRVVISIDDTDPCTFPDPVPEPVPSPVDEPEIEITFGSE
jgi:hypothetical protein